MTTSDGDLRDITEELSYLSLKRQQLLERKNIQCLVEELKNRPEFRQTEEAASTQHEIDSIDDRLKQLADRKAKLRQCRSTIISDSGTTGSVREVIVNVDETTEPREPVSGPDIFYIPDPPTSPAPEVTLDVERLAPCPCRTQCPACRQIIMTETTTSVSSSTWLLCVLLAFLGCVAGCCLIPFCLKRFKSTNHRCPKCRTLIKTIEPL